MTMHSADPAPARGGARNDRSPRLARATAMMLLAAWAGGCGGGGTIEPAHVTADQVQETLDAIARAQGSEAALPRQTSDTEATNARR